MSSLSNSTLLGGGRPAAAPLSARSVIASVLLGSHPPCLPAAALVRAGRLFDIAEGTIRVALSRMVAAGELAAGDGSYQLAGRLLERQDRQDASRRPLTRPWDGSWSLAVVASERRGPAERAALRAAAASLNMAELREGVWLRPDNLHPDRAPAARRVVEDQCQLFSAAPRADAAELASSLWDLAGWQASALALREAMDGLGPALAEDRPEALAAAFSLSAAVLRCFLADPLLPAELLPVGWPGDALRAEHEAFDRLLRASLRRWSLQDR